MSKHQYRVSEAAALLSVSDDTVRRWASSGRLDFERGAGGVQTVAGAQLAALATEIAAAGQLGALGDLHPSSARNRMRGIVTAIKADTVMAQVDVQAGPFRLVSLVTREAVEELELEVGSLVVASVKATNVGIEGVQGA